MSLSSGIIPPVWIWVRLFVAALFSFIILQHLSRPVDNTTQKTMLQTGRQPLSTKASNRTVQITEHKKNGTETKKEITEHITKEVGQQRNHTMRLSFVRSFMVPLPLIAGTSSKEEAQCNSQKHH
tara:strand:+ start:285 stop:659 length:375 start_codon:yes stop_codon:yes gene_type:complete